MIGLDTNVLLRFLLADEPSQHEAATRFLGERTRDDPAFISSIVLAEVVWFLQSRSRVPQGVVAETLREILRSKDVRFEDETFLDAFLGKRLAGDIADHLIACAARRAGAQATVTFDRKAARSVPGMVLLS